jgi:hypothetical protein
MDSTFRTNGQLLEFRDVRRTRHRWYCRFLVIADAKNGIIPRRLVPHDVVFNMIDSGRARPLPMRFESIAFSLACVADTQNPDWSARFEYMMVYSPPTEINHGWADFLDVVAFDVAKDFLWNEYFCDLTLFVARFIADQFRIWYIAEGRYHFEFDRYPMSFYRAVLGTKGWIYDYIHKYIDTMDPRIA